MRHYLVMAFILMRKGMNGALVCFLHFYNVRDMGMFRSLFTFLFSC